YGPTTVNVTWPDGSRAKVLSIGKEGVNLLAHLAAARAGHVTGLLGNDDDNLRNDFVGRNGHRYSFALLHGIGLFGGTAHAQHVAYDQFGASWLIRPSQSLFVYPPGKTTRSYRIRGFPRHSASLTAFPTGL